MAYVRSAGIGCITGLRAGGLALMLTLMVPMALVFAAAALAVGGRD